MVLRSLGTTGLRVSPLGLGTVKFGRNQGVKYPQSFTLPDDRTVAELLALARELGINLLDTAPAYGSSEERVGQWLRHRQDWVIVTKVGEQFTKGLSHFDFSATATRLSVERSLKRLRTDWLDIVLIHSNGEDLRILREEGALATLLELRRQGLVRAVGMSIKTVEGGLLALEHCDLVMVTYNPLYRDELAVIRTAHAAGKGVLIKKGLLSGHLGQMAVTDPVEASLRLIFMEPGATSVVVGTLNPDHLRVNVTTAQRVLDTVHKG